MYFNSWHAYITGYLSLRIWLILVSQGQTVAAQAGLGVRVRTVAFPMPAKYINYLHVVDCFGMQNIHPTHSLPCETAQDHGQALSSNRWNPPLTSMET